MKAMYIVVIVAMILLGALTYILVTRSDHKRAADLNKQQTENPYLGLRKQILELKPEDLNLNFPTDKETAFCVILEFGTNEGAATIVSLSTGDASMYTSSGGGIIGGASYENINKAAVDFVSSAQNYFAKMGPESIEVPKPNHIKFHILTNQAHYSFDGLESEVTSEQSEWAGLFDKGNNVLTQLRLTTEHN